MVDGIQAKKFLHMVGTEGVIDPSQNQSIPAGHVVDVFLEIGRLKPVEGHLGSQTSSQDPITINIFYYVRCATLLIIYDE
jgi:hypothetical protein